MAKGELTLEKRGKRKDVDMTQGDILRHIVVFALPLLAGNVFQQLYNMVDTIVVGQFVSTKIPLKKKKGPRLKNRSPVVRKVLRFGKFPYPEVS